MPDFALALALAIPFSPISLATGVTLGLGTHWELCGLAVFKPRSLQWTPSRRAGRTSTGLGRRASVQEDSKDRP